MCLLPCFECHTVPLWLYISTRSNNEKVGITATTWVEQRHLFLAAAASTAAAAAAATAAASIQSIMTAAAAEAAA